MTEIDTYADFVGILEHGEWVAAIAGAGICRRVRRSGGDEVRDILPQEMTFWTDSSMLGYVALRYRLMRSAREEVAPFTGESGVDARATYVSPAGAAVLGDVLLGACERGRGRQ